MRIKRRNKEDADLDITSFMNLMIILVPVLLMSMVLARTSVLDLKLPDISAGGPASDEPPKPLEVIIRHNGFDIYYAGSAIKQLPKTEAGDYDYSNLSLVLQEAKRMLQDQGIAKKDIYLLLERDIPYQTLVSTMDTARSFKAVVAADVVNAELFPEIALGDAPGDSASAGGAP